MTKYLLAAISVAFLGCAASPPPGPTAPSGSVPGVMEEVRRPPGGDGFTSRADCDKLVDHIDSIAQCNSRFFADTMQAYRNQ